MALLDLDRMLIHARHSITEEFISRNTGRDSMDLFTACDRLRKGGYGISTYRPLQYISRTCTILIDKNTYDGYTRLKA